MKQVIIIGNREIEVVSDKSGIFLKFAESYRSVYLTTNGARELAAALVKSADYIESRTETS